ncbi:MAG TPA: hypothetical protein VFA59_07405 [Vicinamibacterales bacterium]|nr:hypothetical protein [Vicinamibacterales bacterium]
MTRQELALLRSVTYASLFDYPLTLDQLHRSLIECEMSPHEVLATYDRSDPLQRVVDYRDGYFFPAGGYDLVAERRRRELRSREFLAQHRLVLRLICAIPFTRLVALSGSLAHFNLEPDGDLDLFIITKGAHVWTVTLAILLLTKAMRCRRAICANFIIADTHLALEQQDVFTANQVVHLKPLIGASALDDFLAANPFVAHYYPNAVRQGLSSVVAWRQRALDRAKRALERLLAWPSPLLESTARTLYGWYLRRRAARWRSPEQVRLQTDYLKLHTQSHRRSILDRFNAAMEGALVRAAENSHASPMRIRSAAR